MQQEFSRELWAQNGAKTWNFLNVFLLVLSSVLLVTLIWGLSRGFDITDESFYLLSYKHLDETRSGTSVYHYFVHALTGWLNGGVVFYRLLRVAGLFFSSLFLPFALLQTRLGETIDYWVMAALIFIGGAMGFSFLPQTFSYNDMIQLIVLFVIALGLCGFTSRQFQNPCFFIAGLLWALGFGVKFPSAILLFVPLGLVVWRYRARLNPLYYGFGCGLLAVVIAGRGPAAIFNNFKGDYAILQATGFFHGPSMLALYLHQFWEQIILLLKDSPFLVISILVQKFNHGHFRGPRTWGVPALTLIFLGIALNNGYFEIRPNGNGMLFHVFLMLILFQFIGFLTTYSWRTETFAFRMKFLVLLLVAPVICAFGTANELFYQSFLHSGFLFATLALLTPPSFSPRLASVFNVLAVVLVATILFYKQYDLQPYNQGVPLHQQTSYNSNLGVWLDPAKNNFFNGLSDSIPREKTSHQPILYFFNGSGVVYALGGYSLGEQWYFSGMDQRTCAALEKGQAKLKDVKVILSEGAINAAITQCLTTLGLNPTEQFDEKMTMNNPYPGRLPVRVLIRR